MKIIKTLIIISFFVLITSFSFGTSTGSDKLSNAFPFLQDIVEFAYLLLRPFLIIAGKFLSNDFVYGSVFGIDSVLWQLWQVVRVFANYFIGFVFIASIFVYFFKADSNLSWKKNLPKVAIAAVFVNISWFLIAVLIDISTILTLAAGSIGTTFQNISSQKDLKENNLMVPIVIDTDFKGNFISIKGKDGKIYNSCIKDEDGKITNSPCFSFKDGNFKILDETGKLNESLTKNIGGISSEKISGDNTGMLVSLFRYMNGAFLVDNTNNDVNKSLINLMKLLLLLILILPFILLTIILVIRVVVLWVVIPLSPFILSAYILGIFDSQIKQKIKDIITLIFQPAYIVFMLSIGFVFIQAIHAMIPNEVEKNKLEVLSIYDGGKNTIDETKKIELQTVNIGGKEGDDIMFTIQSEYNKGDGTNEQSFDYKNLLYYIPWIIANLLSAFVLWSLVFIAFKSNSITNKISNPIEGFVQSWIKTTPILPGGHSVASLEQTGQHLQSIPRNISQQQTSLLSNLFNKKEDKDKNKDKDKDKDKK